MRNIALTTDFSDQARKAYAAAASIAKERNATIQLVHEVEPPPPFYFEHVSAAFPIRDYYDRQAKMLTEERGHAALESVPVETELLYEGARHENLLEFLTDEAIDLLVLATHGRSGFGHVLLGSFTEKIVRRSPVPVLTVRGREGEGFAPTSVLVPFDFSKNAEAVLACVRELADRRPDTTFTFVQVESPRPHHYGDFLRDTSGVFAELRLALAQASERSRARFEHFVAERLPGVRATLDLRRGAPAAEIVALAKEIAADLILMATHGRTGLERFFLGSVAERVLRTAPCSVLTVRPAPSPSDAATTVTRPEKVGADES